MFPVYQPLIDAFGVWLAAGALIILGFGMGAFFVALLRTIAGIGK